ncbi:cytochrome C biosynthesis protein [Adhaeribacter sp. BT258]|uniref:Cytochrome C biosynthesis protein n=1 Tax=Adhaeribacter terrigena TaxID=2793070 RepID=A0ABS1C2C1_9BACT|nr:tetratricopeptide repeat protein [Adhaeribacter terrigena]MBK0403549.1 cytochrome C biosynthesis protein [Adhaeribacter terrigena]
MAIKNTTDPDAAKSQKAAEAAKQHEYDLLQDPDALAERLTSGSEDFVKKHKNTLLGVFVAIALVIAGSFAYYGFKKSQEEEAQIALYPAVYDFEADSLNKALNGDARYKGLNYIAEEYSGTKAGNLAKFYAGVVYLKQGKFQEAIDKLEDFSSDDLILQARAYSLIGDANMELNKPAEASEMYMKAANYKANEFFAPQYLMKAGMAYEAAKNYKEAADAYNKIISTYATATEVNDAKKYKARAEMLASN